MAKPDNFNVNLLLRGFTSIQVGIYIIIAAYIFQSLISGFLVDDNPAGMMSVEIIELIVVIVMVLVIVFSSFAIYFKGRRLAKRNHHKLWNKKTKKAFAKFLAFLAVTFITLLFLKNKGYISFIVPAFLVIYGNYLYIVKTKKRKTLLVITGLCLLLAAYCFVIPSYWYYSLFTLGIAHITYGVVVKNHQS